MYQPLFPTSCARRTTTAVEGTKTANEYKVLNNEKPVFNPTKSSVYVIIVLKAQTSNILFF